MKKFIVLLFIISGISFAQDQGITIGNTSLKIGMELESVLGQLEKSLYVEEDFNTDNLFAIWDSNKRNFNYGSLKFDENNKLVMINKFWSSVVNDSHSQVFEQLIKLLDIYKKDGEIKVETKEVFQPNYQSKMLSFIQGNKVIEVSIIGNRITLQETLVDSN
jgi:hypothetical protein